MAEESELLESQNKKARNLNTFAALRYRNYQLYFGGQLVSVAGTWMQVIAQGWLVYQLSKSETTLGVVAFASAIPVLAITPVAGVVIDRVNKRNLLVLTQAGAMLLAFILAALVFTGAVQIWHILILSMAIGAVNAFDAPARQAFVVEMVGREHLSNGIALNSMMFNGARVIGPALGGILLAALGPAWCFLINGLSFLAVIAGLLAMRIPPAAVKTPSTSPYDQMKLGLRYAYARKELLGLLLLSTLFSVFGLSYTAVLPAFADRVLGAGPSGYGSLNAAIGLGAVAAALLVASFGDQFRRGRLVMVAYMGYHLLLVGFAFNRWLPAALLLTFIMGTGFMTTFTFINSLLQLNVDDEMRGRVMSLYTLSFGGIAPFGNLAMGYISERWGLGPTIAVSAAISLVFALGVFLAIPKIKQLR